jgi:monofunctional glycosyltransferase
MPRTRPQKRIGRRWIRWTGAVLAVCIAVSVFQVALLRWVDPRFTVMSAWQWMSHKGGDPEAPPRMMWRPLDAISPHIRRAVLAGEDQRFLSHRGFDFTEIGEALKDMAARRGLRGASTITMQTARTVFLWPARSLFRKVLEAYYTILMETLWDKERILEIYLNTVDWGKGIMGIEAASRHYFGVSSAHISRRQAALAAAILPSPHRASPVHPDIQTRQRQERILRDLDKMPLITRENRVSDRRGMGPAALRDHDAGGPSRDSSLHLSGEGAFL